MHGGCGLTGSVLAATTYTLSFLYEKHDAPNLNVSLDVCSSATLFPLSSSIPSAELIKLHHLGDYIWEMNIGSYLETMY